MKTHNLTIADQRIVVRSPATADYVGRLAADLDDRVRRVSDQGADRSGAALVVALGLADELSRTQAALAETQLALESTRARLAEARRAALDEAQTLRAAAGLPPLKGG